MRVPSGRGTRGWTARGCLYALLALASFGAGEVHAQAITRFARDTGNINFVTTGGSLRNSPNTGSPCAVNATSSQQLSGIPVGRTVRNAYLYWGGSGNSPDTTVTLNGNNVTASRTFTRTFNNGTAFNFFGGFADVTSIVAPLGNANYTFGGLNVSTGNPWCGSQAVVGGWSLIVIYEGAGERLRAVNLYDGLDYFYGSQVTLTPDGFRVPATNIDGRVAVFTLEGDPQNSTSSNGISEALRFNGTALDDGLEPAGSNPVFQQFDGTINTQGVDTSYGIDVDQYDVGNLLSTGQTSATTVYSAGADLVLLMAQVVSATSDPAVNLGITVGHGGDFVAGQTGQYAINVSNAVGFEREDNTVTVSTTLPTGLTFNAGTGTGWSCSAAGQVVTCTHAPTLNAGASFPTLTLAVNVLETAAATVNLTAAVSSDSFDSTLANNTATDPTNIVFPNLSTSTKTVQDLNGGEANPGDILRYTITLIESAGFVTSGVTVTDHIPANVSFGGFVAIPAGATSSFSPPPNGDNDTGVITVSNISVPANASRTVVFDVVVANVSPGANIANVATVTNPNGPDGTPAAPTVPVSPSQIPGSGTKQLYLWSNPQRLTRTRPTGTHSAITINGNNQSETFTLNPPLQSALTLNAGNFNVHLLLARTGSNFGTRTVTVTLTNSALGAIASASQSFSSTSQTLYTFTLNTTGVTAPAGSTFSLVVNNNSNNTSNRSVSLTPYNGSNYSRVDLNSATVINVDSVSTWNAAFNGGTAQNTFAPGDAVFVRALISDPFGSFDISSARITVLDPANNVVVNDQPMTAQGAPATCNSTSAATCLFQYPMTLSGTAAEGPWTVQITGFEGVEGVQDIGVGSFQVAIPRPTLTVVKTSSVLSDPVNLAVNPRRIPGAVVRYDVTVTNSGPGVVDAGTLVLTDAVPANSSLYVLAAGNPVAFINGATTSGLSFDYATHVTYSSTGPAGPWNYTPSPDAGGFDPAVRAVRIAPGGSMNAASGGNPSFTLQFRVRID
jgi:uncharacterized repeat protein (TIGR01451 family)